MNREVRPGYTRASLVGSLVGYWACAAGAGLAAALGRAGFGVGFVALPVTLLVIAALAPLVREDLRAPARGVVVGVAAFALTLALLLVGFLVALSLSGPPVPDAPA